MNKTLSLFIAITTLTIYIACQPTNQKNKDVEIVAQKEQHPIQIETQNGLKKAYFASGCFWCVEAIYESVKGVKESVSGYSGGEIKNPTYTKQGNHAEAVEILYDPAIISFKTLIDVYFGSQNITQINGQGPDRGQHYRSIIFYQNEEEKNIIAKKIKQLNVELGTKKVAAEVLPFQKFWLGEDYHQDYERLHPENPYIQNISIPRLKRFQKKFPQLLKTGH